MTFEFNMESWFILESFFSVLLMGLAYEVILYRYMSKLRNRQTLEILSRYIKVAVLVQALGITYFFMRFIQIFVEGGISSYFYVDLIIMALFIELVFRSKDLPEQIISFGERNVN